MSLLGRVRRWLTDVHGLGLGSNRDLGVSVGRVEADVPEPGANDIELSPAFEQARCRRVAEDMRRNPPWSAIVMAKIVSVTAHNLVETETGECASATPEYGSFPIRQDSLLRPEPH